MGVGGQGECRRHGDEGWLEVRILRADCDVRGRILRAIEKKYSRGQTTMHKGR